MSESGFSKSFSEIKRKIKVRLKMGKKVSLEAICLNQIVSLMALLVDKNL
jgi:hypothetical protein